MDYNGSLLLSCGHSPVYRTLAGEMQETGDLVPRLSPQKERAWEQGYQRLWIQFSYVNFSVASGFSRFLHFIPLGQGRRQLLRIGGA